MSFGDMVIWVEAKTLEKPLLSENEWMFGIWEKNPQDFLGFSEDGFVIGDTEFSRAAMNLKKFNGGMFLKKCFT